MKSPRKNLRARSSVTSRKSATGSPGWTSATEVFKSPKTPSPKQKATRRTSTYKSKASGIDKFKMPETKIFSPPGVKTRARRSSIYQKGGTLLSPKNTRSRRASMYVSSKASTDTVKIFSKVWATPIRQPEPIQEDEPAQKVPAKNTSPKRSLSPKKIDLKSPIKTGSPQKRKTPKSSKKPISKTSPSANNEGKSVASTPRSAKKSVQQSVVSAKKLKTAIIATPESNKEPTVKLVASGKRKRKSASFTPALNKNSPKAKSRRKMSPSPSRVATPVSAKKKTSSKTPVVITSTPSKTVEEITGKSFYGTPGETPIPSQRTDEVFVFSAVPVKSAKKSARKSVFKTPEPVPVSTKKTVRRSARRSMASEVAPQSPQNENPDEIKPAAKRAKISPKTEVIRSAGMTEINSSPETNIKLISKNKLSPEEMSSVLRSVEIAERAGKRKASGTPYRSESKNPKLNVDAADLPTPRVYKKVKRSSPKKIADIVSVCQNTNNSSETDAMLNDTVNTDSRSGRCIIL